ncbi:MAG: serine/threonine protein kinase [Pirellulales bacterium]
MGMLDSFRSFFSGSRLDVARRFAIQRKAISGTMSKFYMARDLKTGEIVGLKILDPAKTAAFEARFTGLNKPGEGEIAIQLKHPRIVRTFEHGRTTNDEAYLIMEFIDGPDLNSMIVAGDPLLEGRRVRFLRQAAEALAAVHGAGFIHRDVCPRNLLLCQDREHIKLIDFGLTVPATKTFMQPGNRTGTPNYMAPEIVRRQSTDHRVDVFAFGVSAYEILTGRLPWPKGATGLAALTHDRPPDDIRRHRSDIHPKLAEVVHRCLAAEPARRCPSMDAFLQAVRKVEREDA